jgi:hypothetical protein
MARAFHNQAQIVAAGKVYTGNHVVGGLRGHGVGARFRGPGIYPAERLSETDLVAKVVGILQLLKEFIALRARRP